MTRSRLLNGGLLHTSKAYMRAAASTSSEVSASGAADLLEVLSWTYCCSLLTASWARSASSASATLPVKQAAIRLLAREPFTSLQPQGDAAGEGAYKHSPQQEDVKVYSIQPAVVLDQRRQALVKPAAQE